MAKLADLLTHSTAHQALKLFQLRNGFALLQEAAAPRRDSACQDLICELMICGAA
jgi:hypothetical protein